MQIKTIKKNLENKLNEWLETITDTELQKDLKENILVSGGSILSMLLNEKVNDYDVYIKDVDVLKRLCEYYTKQFLGIRVLDGREKELYFKEVHKGFTDSESETYNSAFKIAITNLHADQIKLWFENKTGMFKPEYHEENKSTYKPVFYSPNAISLSDDIQIVVRFHGDSEAIHKTFDFVHATNYFTFEEGLVTNKGALESIITKQLRYMGSQYPVTSVIRMKKFIKRGWNIGAGEILKMLFQVSELNLKDPNVLEEQLIGVDIAYFSLLIQILRDVPSEKMCSNYLNAIIDKVFNSIEGEE